jgi:hypothetical protein
MPLRFLPAGAFGRGIPLRRESGAALAARVFLRHLEGC